jgi:calcineurin-like phosphoesterase family protein
MTTFFTSDTHFGHQNIIKYCNRPYATAQEMDEDLIAKWNAKVKQNDLIFHLGDFGFSSEQRLLEVIRRLNGRKFLVFGNHDKTIRNSDKLQKHFETMSELTETYVNNQYIIMCHYSMVVWNKSHRGSWQLFGHSHGSLPVDLTKKSMDVGVDSNGYAPISFDEVKLIMDQRVFVPVDHHGEK